MRKELITASIIFAAGKGSRMKGYKGNKTLLPLIAGPSPFEGSHPILLQVLNCLPPGPKALVINHGKEEVIKATRSLDLIFCEQPLLNGTGGALLASREFIENQDYDRLLISMGDVPFVRPSSFDNLLKTLNGSHMVVLGFKPADKKKYGVLEIGKENVKRIIEWKYWSQYSKEKQDRFDICNSGIYAARKNELIQYLDILEKRPHKVIKERDNKMVEIEEFFIPDLVELMYEDGLKVGYVVTTDENEVMGVDDLQALTKAQEIFTKGV
ncbi:NTP transferase domain-containing protein [Thermodesulfobacteriota bacterium]